MKLRRWDWAFAAAFAALIGLAIAGPVSAEPTVDVTTGGAPEPGDILPIHLDGSSGYDGVASIRITGCGNWGRNSGLATEYSDELCHDSRPNALSDGDLFSRVGELGGPADGVDYTFDYVWSEHENECRDQAPVPCILKVTGHRADGSEQWRQLIELSDVGALPTLSISGAVTQEGDDGWTIVSLPITVSRPVDWSIFIKPDFFPFQTDASDSAWPEFGHMQADLYPVTFSVRLAPGETNAEYVIRVFGDETDEFDEVAIVSLGRAEHATIGGYFGLAPLTILNDDAPPVLIPGAVEVLEGDFGTTIVSMPFELSAPSGKTVEFDYLVGGHDGTVAGVDYVAASGHLVIAPGETVATVDVEILGDTIPENDEFVLVGSYNIENARPGGLWGLGFINVFNDEAFPDCLDRLFPGENLSWCDFSGERFIELDLHGADLRHANLQDTLIIAGDFSGINALGASTVGAAFIGTDLAGATISGNGAATFLSTNLDDAEVLGDFSGSVFSSGSALRVRLDGGFGDAAFSLVDMTAADIEYGFFPRTSWGRVVCPDGQSSETTFDTCQRIRIEVADSYSGTSEIVLDAPPAGAPRSTRIIVDLFGAPTFTPGLQSDIGVGSTSHRFGPNGIDAVITTNARFDRDADGDGWNDSSWQLLREDSSFQVGDTRACVAIVLRDEQRVWGCVPITVTQFELPPISPPASPPASAPSSPPISGNGSLGDIVPLLKGPLGLMVTASGVGLVFLLGSSRAGNLLEAESRKEEDDEHDPAGAA